MALSPRGRRCACTVPAGDIFPGDVAADTVEALLTEHGRDRPLIQWLLVVLIGCVFGALPFIKVDLWVRGRGVVTTGAGIATMIPADETPEVARHRVTISAFFPQDVANLVKVGQSVKIQYDAFPYTVWGAASGTVAGLSAEPVATLQRPLCKVVVESSAALLRLDDGREGVIRNGMAADLRLTVCRKSLLQLVYQRSDRLFAVWAPIGPSRTPWPR